MQKAFVVYKSSAGSGKTFTLVKEYLKIVLNDKSKAKNVLAITFTNAAAAEMKSRIIEALGEISKLDVLKKELWPESLKSLMIYVVGENSSDAGASENANENNDILSSIINTDNNKLLKVIRSAADVLSIILHNYGDFAVSTIDSFTHRIIRTFAFDLQIPMNFEIEMDAKALLGQAVDLLVSRVGTDTDGSLTKLMLAYMERSTDEERKLSIEKGILGLASVIIEEDLDNNVQKLKNISLDDFFNIQKTIVSKIHEFEKEIAEIAELVVKELDSRSIPDASFYRGAQGISTFFRNLAKGLVEEKIEHNSYVATTIEENKWVSSKCEKPEEIAISEIQGLICEMFYKIQDKKDKELDNYRLLKLINKNIFPLAVLNEVEKVLEEIKSQNSLLHISDFNKKIANIVAEQPVPFIYERLGEKYQHYMIDEFQDTSLLQWQNLLPLIENALANGNMNLVVGDCKQAIYRWRGGEVEQFAHLPKISSKIKSVSKPNWEKALNDYYYYRPLDTNYRSLEEVVKFNNDFFDYVHKNVLIGDFAKIYEDSGQKSLPNKSGGYVHLEFIPSDEDEEGRALLENTLDRTLEIILELRDEYKHPLSDITILCRSNYHANLTARFLLENNISVISQESLLLEFSPDVNFMVSFLKLIVNPSDKIAFTEIVNSLCNYNVFKDSKNIHDILKEIDELPVNKDVYSDKHIRKLESLLKLNDYEVSFSYLRNINLLDICEFLVRKFFSKQQPVNPFIAFFMDAVFDFVEKNASSIDDFLQWWQERKSNYSVVVPKGIDAVQIMTIHKAKGLQFPVVVFPFVNMSTKKTGLNGFWHGLELDDVPELSTAYFNYRKELENTCLADIYLEEKQRTLLDLFNVVYVGFTRPQQKLFVLSNYPKNNEFKEAGNTIAFHLHKYLESKNLWVDGSITYTFGDNTILKTEERVDKPKEDEQQLSQVVYKKYISNDWKNKIYIRPTIKSPKVEEEKQLALIRGRLMHKAMEQIYQSNDVEKVLEQMLVNGEISGQEKNEMLHKILSLIESPEISMYYGKNLKIMNEANIINEKGDYYRPDRVVISGKQAAVIDYKTGIPSDSYKKQLLYYSTLLSKMGYSPINAFLVYLDKGVIEKV